MNDEHPADSNRADPIFQSGYSAAWMFCLLILGLSILGLVRFPHWIWSTPIVVAVAALVANFRWRTASPGWTNVLLGVLVLVLVIGAGVLAGLASRVSH